jgi:oxepin-CoA hydrolase/3-oxo-5,6-dehydrosuberyl-CoA semialdehyde dehydrogenase
MNTYQHKKLIEESFKKLTPETKPLWGKMTAQHMVEHLTNSINISNGRRQLPFNGTEEETAKEFLMSEHRLPRGIQTSANGELPALRHDSLEKAKQELTEALDAFEDHHSQNPDAKYAHPRFGHLNRQEWDKFHDKHFNHHLRQFGLID